VGDILLLEEVFKDAAFHIELREATNAVQAFTYFVGVKRGTGPRKPAFVILDINMPIYPGFDVLQAIKEDPQLKDIPVVVFTSSTDERCRRRCLEMGADDYIAKPMELSAFREVAGRIKRKYVG
jgi:CheY-like chemotaxis protein